MMIKRYKQWLDRIIFKLECEAYGSPFLKRYKEEIDKMLELVTAVPVEYIINTNKE